MAIAVVVPLAIMPDTDDATVIKQALFRFAVAGLGCGWILMTIRSHRLAVIITPLNLPLLGLFTLTLASLFWSVSPASSLTAVVTLVAYIVLYMILVMVLSEDQIRRIATAFVMTGALISAYGLCQRLGIDVIAWGTDFATEQGQARVFATLGHPNFLGGYLIPVFTLAIVFLITEPERPHRLGYLAITVLTGLCLLATLSRGAWLGTGVALAVLGGYTGRRFLSPRRIAGLGLVGVIALLLVYERAFSLQNVSARTALWESAILMIRDAPLLGHGAGAFGILFPQYRPEDYWLRGLERTVAHVHNEVLEVGVELGIVGIVLFVWLFVRLFRWIHTSIRIMPDGRSSALLMGMGASIAGILTQNFLDVGLRWTSVGGPFWLLVALAGALAVRSGGSRAIAVAMPPLPPFIRRSVSLACLLIMGLIGAAEVKGVLADRALMDGQRAISARDWPRAVAAFRYALRLAPEHQSALYKLGYTYIQSGEPEQAVAVLRRLESSAPHYAEVDRNLGLACLQLGKMEEAIRRYETAARMDRIEQNWYDLAQLYEMNREPGKAVHAYEVFLPLASTYLIQHRQRRKAHQARSDANRVAFEEELIWDAQIRVRTASAFLMEAYVAASNWAEARRSFQRWVDEQPEDDQAFYYLGYALQQTGAYETAVAAYKTSLALNDRQAPALNNLAVIYTAQEAYLDTAVVLIRRALALAPEDAPYYLDSLGWAYFKKGDPERAIRTLQDGIAQCPEDKTDALTELFFHLGLIYEHQENHILARQYLQQAIALAPRDTLGHKAYTALQRLQRRDGP